MKLKLHKDHKSKTSKKRGETEEEKLLKTQRKALSFTRTKDRPPKTQEAKQTAAPGIEDFRDLIDDDEEPQPDDDELLGTGFPRRSKSSLYGKPLMGSQSMNEPKLERVRSSRQSEPGDQSFRQRPAAQTVAESREPAKEDKPLPRLVAPRATVAETIAASRAASMTQPAGQTLDKNPTPDATHGQEEDEAELASETQPINELAANETKKKKHSTIGHLWKQVKNDLLNPKAVAADLTAISVSAASMSMSAAKQAGAAMNTVAAKVETDISNLHDQILGGKRNLPDHSPTGKPATRSKKAAATKSDNTATKAVEISVIAIPPKASHPEGPVTPRAEDIPSASSNRHATTLPPHASTQSSAEAKATQPVTAQSKAKSSSAQAAQASDGLAVQKSKGSAYMLSKYEEEPDSPSVLTEALTKTAEALTQGTKAVLSNANGNARYLRRMLMCGIGGRHKN